MQNKKYCLCFKISKDKNLRVKENNRIQNKRNFEIIFIRKIQVIGHRIEIDKNNGKQTNTLEY